MPIPLANAVVRFASPKSNNAYKAIDRALADLELGYDLSIPNHLKTLILKAQKLSDTQAMSIRRRPGNIKHWIAQRYLLTLSPTTSTSIPKTYLPNRKKNWSSAPASSAVNT